MLCPRIIPQIPGARGHGASPGHNSLLCLQTTEPRATPPAHFGRGRSSFCPCSKTAQLLPSLEPKFFLIFLLLKAACAKFSSIHTWKWSTWVSVYWGCRFSLHLGMFTGTRDYSAPKPFQVFLGEWLSTVDNRDFLSLTKL